MAWAQWLLLIRMVLGVLIHAFKHGEERDDYHARVAVIVFLIDFLLFWGAGAFTHIFG